MDILAGIADLFGSLRTAFSPQTLIGQWNEMTRFLAPKHAEQKGVADEEGRTVLKMSVRMGHWPEGKGALITTNKQNFTFGNADIFDICLDPRDEEVGDVWCSAFFDKKLGGFVFMQATGMFRVCVTDRTEPYRAGDWSLYPDGFDYQTVPQTDILIPLSSGDAPETVRFCIGHSYYFEAWCCKEDSADTETKENSVQVQVLDEPPQETEQPPQDGSDTDGKEMGEDA